jgi:hypothetical protein
MNKNLKIFEKNTFEFCCLIRNSQNIFSPKNFIWQVAKCFYEKCKKSFILIGITISY